MTRIRIAAAATAAVLIAVVVVLGAGRGAASAAGPTDLLPDLVADPPTGAALEDYQFPDRSHQLLLRFNGFVHNAGAGALDIRASRASPGDPMPPKQRVYRSDSTAHDDDMPGARLLYSNADGHHHWHLQDVARYSLWDQGKAQEVAPSAKVGFCLMDSQRMETSGPASAVYTDEAGRRFCQQDVPDALSLFEGVSSGWRDIYDSSLALQWVVASDVLPGRYWLREDVDPDAVIHESNETNAAAYATSQTTIPGYLAKALTPSTTPFGQAQDVALDATQFGANLGPRRFTVVRPPAHGSLDVATGASFADPTVTYTPSPGYTGSDSFTYEAFDSNTAYPRNPGIATVGLSVGVPAPAVVIDSAPSSIETGHGVQLHAQVTNDSPTVTWSVDGTDGGGAASGTITSGGFYTAPASVPPGGSVTISARSAGGAHDERTVAITAPPPQQPAPSPPETAGSTEQPAQSGEQPAGGDAPPQPPSKPAKKTRLGPLAIAVAGRALVVRVTPREAGTVAVHARIGHRRLRGCLAKLPASRRFACRITLPRHPSLRRLRVEAVLKARGKVVARRVSVGAPLVSGRTISGRELTRRARAFLLCSF